MSGDKNLSGDSQVLRPIARLLLVTQIFALLLIVGGGALLFSAAREFHRASAWVEHTQEVMSEIDDLRISLLRGGLALRNYALSPDKDTLKRVRDSTKSAAEGAAKIQALVSDDPGQTERAFVLASETAEVVGWTNSIVVIAERDGVEALQASLRFRAKRDAAKGLREALASMEEAENALLAQRNRERQAEYSRLKFTAIAAAVCMVAFLAWSISYAAVLFRRGNARIGDLRTSADRDPLTGLLNRRALVRKFAKMADTPCTVVAFDLDDFKPVNDVHGHHGGDEVLRVTARRLEKECRDNDLIARVGGDEFVVILSGVSQEETATQVCRRLGEALSMPIKLGDAMVKVGASLGHTTSAGGGKLEQLLTIADAAAYEEKRRRKSKRLVLVSNPVAMA